MKKFLLPILLLHLAMAVNAATYYFSTSAGDDSRTSAQAQSSSTPWKTIGKLNSIMYMLKPGDQVLFKRGDTYDGAIKVTASGLSGQPITFGAFGPGNRPVINGFAALSGWTQSRSNVWEAPLSPAVAKEGMIIMNNQQQAIGRYPNRSASNGGYLTIDSHFGLTQLTSSQLPSSPNWAGADVAIRKNRWVLDRSTVTYHAGTTLGFVSGSDNSITDKFGFFIENHTNTLDQNGEWYYDKSRGKLQMYFSADNPDSYAIKASVVETLVNISFQNYVTFNNLFFTGANSYAFDLINSNNITITNCSFNFTGIDAVQALSSYNFTLTNSTINNSNNNGVYMYWNCNNALISNNKIKNSAVIPGMALNNVGTHQGIVIFGDNNMIQYNEVDSSGSNGIHIEGNNSTIQNNFVNTFGFVVDDCGGIYTGQGTEINTVYANKAILNNIVINGIGAVAGTNDTTYVATQGIYLDANTNHVTVSGNTVANCGNAGIFSNVSNNIVISNNTIFNAGKEQFLAVTQTEAASNVTVTGNIMFSKTASQLAVRMESYYGSNNISQFGSFDNNYYCRPIDNNYIFYDMYSSGGKYYTAYDNLDTWKSKFGFDASSKGAPATIPAFNYNVTSNTNRYPNGTYSTNINDVGTFSSTGDISPVWTPSKLDAGTLQVTANNYSSSNNFMLTLPTGTSVTAGKSYLLTFSLQGAASDRPMDVYLRNQDAPNNDISEKYRIPVMSNRQNLQFGFTATSSSRASIELDVNQPNGAVWVDNVTLQDATITPTNPDDYILFKYNATTSSKTITLNSTYYDAKGATYSGKVTLQPYTSLVLFKQSGNSQAYKTTTDAQQSIALQGNLVNANTASVASTSSSKLNWQVDNQASNASYYEVERSSDAVNFTTVGKASAKANNASSVTYEYNDASPLGGKNYYRIRQYDEKGVAAISKIAIVNNIGFKINPNPAKDVLHLFFDQSIKTEDHVGKDVTIRTMSGAAVKTIQLPATDNLSKVDIDVSSLKSGMYILSITSEGNAISKTFLKQ